MQNDPHVFICAAAGCMQRSGTRPSMIIGHAVLLMIILATMVSSCIVGSIAAGLTMMIRGRYDDDDYPRMHA